MRNRTEALNIVFPSNFSFNIFSLLWIVEEPFTDYKYEMEFWQSAESKNYGAFEEWPISFSGMTLTPDMMPISMALPLAKKFASIDGLVDKVQTIREIMNTQYERPVVIYTHCHYGCDRTEEIVGAYTMISLPKRYLDDVI